LPDKSLLSLLLKYMGCFSSEWISVLHARAAKKTNSQFGLFADLSCMAQNLI
jgi:hypothetical protein